MNDGPDASDHPRETGDHGRPDASFPVVGIGASAGGIAALCAFFDSMPADCGMAFVVILHLDPGHASRLPAILSGHTEMPVVEAEDGMPVEPNRVHVIPANAKLSLSGGRLQLGAIDEKRAERRPVDHFLASIAEDCGDLAIAVILSGTGSNGAAGIARVKERGGLVAVQDPSTAEYSGMPGHAAGTGLADLVRPLGELPAALVDYVRHDRVLREGGDAVAEAEPDRAGELGQLLALLRQRTGYDFRAYKDAPVMRRIRRRMGLRQASDLGGYLEALREDDVELAALSRDIMINVTGFFRDPEAWETLRTAAIAPMVAERDPDEPIRAWVPGCASGEEAFSLAMLLFEELEKARQPADLLIFATDSNESALAIARHGIYPASAIEELDPERVERFFVREGDSFRVRKKVRDTVTFAVQNLLQDPPFSRLHLISCRNLLIYLKPDWQRKLTGLFHFALRQGGNLFLGNVESPAADTGMFEPLSKRWRIYRRKGPIRRDMPELPMMRGAEAEAPDRFLRQPPPPQPDPREIAKRVLLERFAPPSVLVDRDLKVLYYFGKTGRFLRHPSGEPTADLGKLLRDGLRLPVRELVQAVHESGRTETAETWLREAGEGGPSRPVGLTASPVGARHGGEVLISFEPLEQNPPTRGEPAAEPDPQRGIGTDDDARRRLQEDLLATRGELAETVGELEASNEDLRASNEEIMSMNEELQSSNEELESSKEELQSLNEELSTVNTQLQSKLNELENKSNDLNNLLNSTETPVLFLDRKFRIRWFTPAIAGLIELELTDVGRPIANFAPKYADGEFVKEAGKVLDDLTPRSTEVQTDEGRHFVRRILPYRTEDDRIDGVVVTFADVTERKRAEHQVAEARDYAEAIVDTVRAPLLGLDGQLKVKSANAAFYRHFRVDAALTEGRLLYELGNGQWDIAELRRLMGDVLPQEKEVDGFAVEQDFPSIGRRIMLLNARAIDDMDRILLSIEDVTERRQAEERQQLLIGELNHRIKNVLNTIQAIAWQTVRRTGSLEEFQQTFGARIQALARCHDVLVQSGWHSAELSGVLRYTLEPYLRDGHDILRDDCLGFSLPPSMALGVTLMLHELATNAAKYGALSTDGGRLEVHCFRADGSGRLHLVWTETGGPKVSPPKTKGFGLQLIEGTVRNELGGEIALDFREEGLRVEAQFPIP